MKRLETYVEIPTIKESNKRSNR